MHPNPSVNQIISATSATDNGESALGRETLSYYQISAPFQHLPLAAILSPLFASQNATIRTSFTGRLSQSEAKVKIMVFSILEENAFTPSWSSDGGKIVFASYLLNMVDLMVAVMRGETINGMKPKIKDQMDAAGWLVDRAIGKLIAMVDSRSMNVDIELRELPTKQLLEMLQSSRD